MIEVQTVRNLFEAYLQTSYLSTDNIIELLWLRYRPDVKDIWDKLYTIREKYLDNVGENEDRIEIFINTLIKVVDE